MRTNIRCSRNWAVSLRFCARDVATDTRREGGSFGVVYKAIERATGEVVAIKHVRLVLLVTDVLTD